MRLPKHKLPKEPSKHSRQTKHKKAQLKDIRRAQNKGKKSEMAISSEEVEAELQAPQPIQPELTPAEKLAAKQARKKANAHKILYKKINSSMTGRNGPREVSR